MLILILYLILSVFSFPVEHQQSLSSFFFNESSSSSSSYSPFSSSSSICQPGFSDCLIEPPPPGKKIECCDNRKQNCITCKTTDTWTDCGPSSAACCGPMVWYYPDQGQKCCVAQGDPKGQICAADQLCVEDGKSYYHECTTAEPRQHGCYIKDLPPQSITVRTFPGSATFNWKLPSMQHPIGCVRIAYNCGTDPEKMDCYLKVDPNTKTATVDGLVEDKNYKFVLATLSADGIISEPSEPIYIIGYVKPTRPRDLHGKGIDLGVFLQWKSPLQGTHILQYIITYSSENEEPKSIKFLGNELNGTIGELTPLVEYSFSITAQNQAGEGDSFEMCGTVIPLLEGGCSYTCDINGRCVDSECFCETGWGGKRCEHWAVWKISTIAGASLLGFIIIVGYFFYACYPKIKHRRNRGEQSQLIDATTSVYTEPIGGESIDWEHEKRYGGTASMY